MRKYELTFLKSGVELMNKRRDVGTFLNICQQNECGCTFR